LRFAAVRADRDIGERGLGRVLHPLSPSPRVYQLSSARNGTNLAVHSRVTLPPHSMTAVDRRSRVDVLGVPVDPLTVPELHEHLLRYVRTGARATVLNANVHAVNL